MSQWVHRLSNIDPDAKTAVCEHCGPFGIVPRGPDRWRCSIGLAGNHGSHGRRSSRKKRARRRVAVALYKTLVGCERCGFTNLNPALLHIHHPEGDGAEYSRRTKAIEATSTSALPAHCQKDSRVGFVAELLRCEVLCSRCTSTRTRKRRSCSMSRPGSRSWLRWFAALALVASGSARRSLSPNEQQAAFLCIHRYEGSWTANTGNGYHGRLQMDSAFERSYGSEFVSMWGHAEKWPAGVQIAVAMRAYASRGFAPWPNTSRMCGLR